VEALVLISLSIRARAKDKVTALRGIKMVRRFELYAEFASVYKLYNDVGRHPR